MRRTNHRFAFCSAVLALIAVLALSTANTSQAAILQFEANLDGLQEVPPNASPAFGIGLFTLNDITGDVTVTSGTYQDLLGGANAVTLNGLAPPGTGAGVLIPLTLDTPGAATGTFSGGGTLAGANIAGMIAGDTYVNIRSSVFPSGEIRGQIFLIPEPSSLVMAAFAGMGALGMGIRRRCRASS